MEAIFFAFLAFIGWGVGDIFVAVSARKLNAYSSTVWSLSLTTFLLGILSFFFLDDLKNMTPSIFLLNSFLGFLLISGIIAFREAFIRGASPIVSVISASFAVVTTILSVIFFQEKLTQPQIIAVLIIFAGLLLTMLNFNDLKKRELRFNKSILLAIFSMFAFGAYFAFIKIPVSEIGWFWPNYISLVAPFPLLLLFIKIRKIKIIKPNQNGALVPLILSFALARTGELSYNLGISKGFASVVAPISGANPVLFVILSAIFLKDPVTKQQILGIITTLIGIVLLSTFSI